LATNMLVTLITFIIILAVLIFVHEFGHFIVAKKSGMGVEEFGFGFPPRLAGIQKSGGRWRWVWGRKEPMDSEQTVYSINWIPLGGFVRITGENNEHQDNPKSFINRPFWARFLTLVAGVLMNFVLAWLLMSAGVVAGLPAAVDTLSDVPAHATLQDQHVAIMDLVPEGPAAKAGLKSGDTIVQVDNQTFADSADLSKYIIANEGKVFSFQIKRGAREQNIDIQSLANPGPDQGPTGIELANVGVLKFPWYLAPWEGFKTLWIQTGNILSGLGQLVTGRVSVSNLGGPVKIAQLTGEVSRMGFIYLLQFTAFLSINLAILNILPFPALDGGRVLFLIIEKVRGKRNNQTVEQWVNTIGFVLLITLMALVTAHDIFNLFHK
ncbi:MAG: RIP metalloprotease RseP, partial [Patescibacteria group bacterium]|nr:RIP metalloprotease RseP [Patescibacteria group bacterium]